MILQTKPIGRSIVTQRYHYTEWTTRQEKDLGNKPYDLQIDPENDVNIFWQPQHQELIKTLPRQLHTSL